MCHLRTILLILACSSALGVEIPDDARTKNPGSYCLWACLQTTGKTHDMWELERILDQMVREYPFGFQGYDELVRGKLTSLGVSFAYQPIGSKKLDLLDTWVEERGVIVALRAGNSHSIGCHAVIVTHWSKEKVCFWDPNKPKHIYQCGRDWLTQNINGEMLVILPKVKE